MEFYVVDPKDSDYQGWASRIRTFLAEQQFDYTEAVGELYYLGDDIAAPWDEQSILFTIEGDEGGVIELRDTDRHFYAFADDLDLFDAREVREAVGYSGDRQVGAVYGFEWNNAKGCRFHLGPWKSGGEEAKDKSKGKDDDTHESEGCSFFTDASTGDYPPVLPLEDVWALFFRSIYWLGNNTSRLQDLKNINVDKVYMDFVAEVEFAHPASLDGLNELLAEEEGYERTRAGLRATFRDRDLAWIQRFVSLLPTEEEDFDKALFRAVWRGACQGEEREVFYVGVERRNLRPFIQLPYHRTSKGLLERFRTHFKGHRIDRQEYNI